MEVMSPTSQGAPERVTEHSADYDRHPVVFAGLVATNTNGFLFLPPCHYVNLAWACDLQPKGENPGQNERRKQAEHQQPPFCLLTEDDRLTSLLPHPRHGRRLCPQN